MKARPFVIAVVGAKQFQRNGFGGCIWTVPSFFLESLHLWESGLQGGFGTVFSA